MPVVPLFADCIRWIDTTFARAKIDLYIGIRLAEVYRAAGLPSPSMLGMARVETGENSFGYEYVAQTIRSLLPLIEKTGTATAAEVDIDTLAQRLRDEVVSRGAAIHMPELIAAWVTKPR